MLQRIDLVLQPNLTKLQRPMADYPYGSMSKGRDFLTQLPVSSTDREKIAHGNAELLLRL